MSTRRWLYDRGKPTNHQVAQAADPPPKILIGTAKAASSTNCTDWSRVARIRIMPDWHLKKPIVAAPTTDARPGSLVRHQIPPKRRGLVRSKQHIPD